MATQPDETTTTETADATIGTLAPGEASAINPPTDLRAEPARIGMGGYLIQVFDYNSGTAHVIGVYTTLEEAQEQIEGYQLNPAQLICSVPVSCFKARD